MKAQVRREYRLRFLTLLSVFFFFALSAGVVASIPYVLPVMGDYLVAWRQSANMPVFEPSDEDRVLLARLDSFKEILNVLDSNETKDPVELSGLIALVVSQKPDRVVLKSFMVAPQSDSGKRLTVSGVAEDRESLVAFSRQLASHGAFSSVDLPVSNLSGREDIEFTIVTVARSAKTE